MGSGYAWRRPGKSHGTSATTGQSPDGVDRLFVFSTSTVFDAERPYGKFAAYALLEHGNDYSAAAKALAAKGFDIRYPLLPNDIRSSRAHGYSSNIQDQGMEGNDIIGRCNAHRGASGVFDGMDRQQQDGHTHSAPIASRGTPKVRMMSGEDFEAMARSMKVHVTGQTYILVRLHRPSFRFARFN
jgi:hypothetical protein